MYAPTAWTRLKCLTVDVAAFLFWHAVFGIHSIESAIVTWWWERKEGI